MNPIVIIAGIGILYLLTRQTPGGPPAVSTNAANSTNSTNSPNSIAIGEPNPATPGVGASRLTREPYFILHGQAAANWYGDGGSYQTPYASGMIPVD